MEYYGVIVRTSQNDKDANYLFLLDHTKNSVMKALLSNHPDIDDLEDYEIMVVKAEFIDRSKSIKDFNLNEFFDNYKSQKYNISVKIQSLQTIAIGDLNDNINMVQDLLESDMFYNQVKSFIDIVKSGVS